MIPIVPSSLLVEGQFRAASTTRRPAANTISAAAYNSYFPILRYFNTVYSWTRCLLLHLFPSDTELSHYSIGRQTDRQAIDGTCPAFLTKPSNGDGPCVHPARCRKGSKRMDARPIPTEELPFSSMRYQAIIRATIHLYLVLL